MNKFAYMVTYQNNTNSPEPYVYAIYKSRIDAENNRNALDKEARRLRSLIKKSYKTDIGASWFNVVKVRMDDRFSVEENCRRAL